jgi:hypothetical protein
MPDDEAAERLARLQGAMGEAGIDGLLLGGDGAGAFAAGHRRIGVHMPGWPLPMTIVPRSGLPHVVTADPDGATHLPADHVHPLMWNPASLKAALPEFLGDAAAGVLGTDLLAPGSYELVRAACPRAVLVDARALLAQVRMPKSRGERAALAEAASVASRAAAAGADATEGSEAMLAVVAALAGQFLARPPALHGGGVSVAVVVEGFVGEARVGPGDPAVLRAAAETLRPGRRLADLARALPAGVEVTGLGRGYEHPVLRGGRAALGYLELPAGAVCLVATETASATVVCEEKGPVYLGAPPERAARAHPGTLPAGSRTPRATASGNGPATASGKGSAR